MEFGGFGCVGVEFLGGVFVCEYGSIIELESFCGVFGVVVVYNGWVFCIG